MLNFYVGWPAEASLRRCGQYLWRFSQEGTLQQKEHLLQGFFFLCLFVFNNTPSILEDLHQEQCGQRERIKREE